nr:unnamed protein product [Spirometra erinaceieuropaei]
MPTIAIFHVFLQSASKCRSQRSMGRMDFYHRFLPNSVHVLLQFVNLLSDPKSWLEPSLIKWATLADATLLTYAFLLTPLFSVVGFWNAATGEDPRKRIGAQMHPSLPP